MYDGATLNFSSKDITAMGGYDISALLKMMMVLVQP